MIKKNRWLSQSGCEENHCLAPSTRAGYFWIRNFFPDLKIFPVHTLSDSLRIYLFIFFPLWTADLKISGFAVEFAGCVWTEAVSGKKKLLIQKYPDTTDTCGRGLSKTEGEERIANIGTWRVTAMLSIKTASSGQASEIIEILQLPAKCLHSSTPRSKKSQPNHHLPPSTRHHYHQETVR